MKTPLAVLHDHLDGGLRVDTILELADDCGYPGLPSTEPAALAAWFDRSKSGSLEAYLEAFTHAVAVMQTTRAIERVAYEAVVDLAADGVVYAELRYAPSHSMSGGLRREDVLEAIVHGLRRGAHETGVVTGAIAVALRHQPDSLDVAQAAARFAGEGVVGFDLAGPEDGFPVADHVPACRLARAAGLGVTLHAGEAQGPESIAQALGPGGAMRIGHGVRITDDATIADGEIVALGALARRIRDLRIPLEMCVTSNVHTVPSLPQTPIRSGSCSVRDST